MQHPLWYPNRLIGDKDSMTNSDYIAQFENIQVPEYDLGDNPKKKDQIYVTS